MSAETITSSIRVNKEGHVTKGNDRDGEKKAVVSIGQSEKTLAMQGRRG